MTGTYYSPLFADLQDRAKGLVGDTPRKRDILVHNLLMNVAEAGDILFDSLITALYSIYFPKIILNYICKAVLGAGNTASEPDEIPTTILRITWPVIKEHVLTLY
jgi:hypothetical protein